MGTSIPPQIKHFFLNSEYLFVTLMHGFVKYVFEKSALARAT